MAVAVAVAVVVAAVVGGGTSMFLVTCSGGGAEGRKPRRSRIAPHACRIRSALPAADISVRGVLGMAGTLSLVCGMMEGLGGARPEDKIGSDDPVKREAAVAAATTLEKGEDQRGFRIGPIRHTLRVYLKHQYCWMKWMADDCDGLWETVVNFQEGVDLLAHPPVHW